MIHISLRSFVPSLRPMRLQFFLLITLLHSAPSFSQSQSDIRSRKIRSITTLTTDARKGDTIIRKNTSRHDAHGNVIESIDYDVAGNVKDWEQFQFNNRDDEILYTHLSPDGKLLRKTETHYNKWNNPTEKVSFDANGNLIEKTVNSYDSANDLISEITNDNEGNLLRKTIYAYDNRGMMISKKTYNEKGALIYSREYAIDY